MNKINSEIMKLKQERNKLLILSKKRKIQEIKMINALNEQRILKKQISKLKNEQKPIGKILNNIAKKYKGVNTAENKRKLRSAYKQFKKFANKYGD